MGTYVMKRYVCLLFFMTCTSARAMNDSKEQDTSRKHAFFSKENIPSLISGITEGVLLTSVAIGIVPFFADHETKKFIQKNQAPIIISRIVN